MDALSTGLSQRSQDADIDSMANMFAGMGIVTKSCSVCGRELGSVDTELGREELFGVPRRLGVFQKPRTAAKEEV